MDLFKSYLRSMIRSHLRVMKRRNRIRSLPPAAAWILLLYFSALAIPVQTKPAPREKPDWEDKIVGSQLTVLELARQILPDIKSDTNKPDKITASDLSRIRLLDGVEATGMELDPDVSDETEVAEPDYFWMKDGKDRLLVLLLKVDGEKVVIGLFTASPKITMLDAVTIAQDIHVDVIREKLWAINSQHEAFRVECWHDNSSESFDSYTFVSVIDHKLRAVAGPVLSSGFATYSSAQQRLCKTSMSLKFQFVPSQGREYFDLIVNEMTLKACHRDSEEWSWKTGVVSNKSVRRLWAWSAKSKQYRRASTMRR